MTPRRRPHKAVKNYTWRKSVCFRFTLHSPQLIFVFLLHEVLYTLSARLSITFFNLMYEYVIYVAQAEDINLFCGEGVGRVGNSADVPLLIGWLNSVCSL